MHISKISCIFAAKRNNNLNITQKKLKMKNLTWQQWTAIGVVTAFIIAAIVLHFVQPKVSYAFTEAASALTFVVGGVAGYLFAKKNPKTEKQMLCD